LVGPRIALLIYRFRQTFPDRGVSRLANAGQVKNPVVRAQNIGYDSTGKVWGRAVPESPMRGVPTQLNERLSSTLIRSSVLDEADVRKPTLVSFPNTLLRNFDCVCM